jgi:uncharacterized protein
MTIVATALWRRLDAPGHDACRLARRGDGWRLEGMAVFRDPGGPAGLAYSVDCDAAWRALRGEVRGTIGARRADFTIARRGETWSLNGRPVPGLERLADLDFGFTPATNLLQIRRAAIAEDAATGLPVAWLDIEAGRLTELPQVYTRRSPTTLWYEAPSFGYAGLLELAATGFVARYPGLWEAEP